jgi:hypothetical protein
MSHSSAKLAAHHAEPNLVPESSAEYLYRSLDNQVVHAREGDWRIRVYSVVEDGHELWLQTSAIGSDVYSVLLRVDPQAEPTDAFAALESWLSGPLASDNRVIDVPAGAADWSVQNKRAPVPIQHH